MFDRQRELLTRKESEMSKVRDREVGKISKARDRQISKIEETAKGQIERARRAYDSQRAEARVEYAGAVASELLGQLDRDYAELQRRSDLSDIPAEAIEAAEKIRTALKGVEQSRVQQIFEAFGPSDETRRAYQFIETGGEVKPADVHSYISADNGTVIFVVPVDGAQNKRLAKGLEDKVDLVLDTENVTLGSQVRESKGQVIGAQVTDLRFSSQMGEANGYLIYEITPKASDASEPLAKGLAAKFTELQPEGFEEARVRHEVVAVEPEVIRIFRERTREELRSPVNELEAIATRTDYVTVEEAARILGYQPRGVTIVAGKGWLERNESGDISVASLVNYIGGNREIVSGSAASRRAGEDEKRIRISYATLDSTPNELREEARKRLAEVGDEITTKDIAYVLGLSSRTSAIVIASRGNWKPIRIEGRTKYFSKRLLEKKVREYTPTNGNGWVLE